MSTNERIFHSLLFEVIALSLLIPFGSLFGGIDMGNMTGLAIGLSLIAMCWNYLYNLVFDKYFGVNRIDRSLALLIGHAAIFELGLLVITMPAIMWLLNMDFISALMLDIGMVIFFLLFAMMYNWCYDIIKHRITLK